MQCNAGAYPRDESEPRSQPPSFVRQVARAVVVVVVGTFAVSVVVVVSLDEKLNIGLATGRRTGLVEWANREGKKRKGLVREQDQTISQREDGSHRDRQAVD
jgi:hypothetical protein